MKINVAFVEAVPASIRFILSVPSFTAVQYQIPLCINFVDFKAAFDSINREFIWKAFSHYGLPSKYIRIFQAFFRSTVASECCHGKWRID